MQGACTIAHKIDKSYKLKPSKKKKYGKVFFKYELLWVQLIKKLAWINKNG